ncbi:MAG: hypothetical protein IPG29_11620 [Sphingobacteriales bacterium]|nr:hypothetical protein [Sphingobacteriales bacterium]
MLKHLSPRVNFHTYIRLFLLFLALSNGIRTINAFAQGFNTDFGQNRVQYHQFIWTSYESPNFTTYFYQGGQNLGRFVVFMAEQNLAELESKLEFKNNNRIDIMVYHNISDLRQTNIGLTAWQTNPGGITKTIGNKVFIYFNGNYSDLQRQVREGIAGILLAKMMHGGNIQEVLQNAVLLNLPDWFINGLTSYLGQPWSAQHDDQLRNLIERKRFDHFNQLEGEEATFAGHALWHYIAQLHGQPAIPNLLYITRVNRSLESGFMFVLGNDLKGTLVDFLEYYQQRYLAERNNLLLPDDSLKLYTSKKRAQKLHIDYYNLKVSPDGRYMAWATSEYGRQKVKLFDTQTKETKIILRNGYRAPNQPNDDVYPLLTWDNKSKFLGVVYDRRDQTRLLVYNAETHERQSDEIVKFQQIYSIDFTNDPRNMVITAMRNGQVDLYLFNIPTAGTVQLTDDYYTDLDANYIALKDRTGILFISNRPTDTLSAAKPDTLLPVGNHNVFLYTLEGKNDGNALAQCTFTPLAAETTPQQIDSTHVGWMSDQNGINNLYVAEFDSILARTDKWVKFKDSLVVNPAYPLDTFVKSGLIDTITFKPIYKTVAKIKTATNLPQGPISSDAAVKAAQWFSLQNYQGRYHFYQQPIPDLITARPSLQNTVHRSQTENLAKVKKINQTLPPQPNNQPTPALPSNSSNTKPNSEPELINKTDLKTDTLDKSEENYFFQSEFETEKINLTPSSGNGSNTTESAANNVLRTAPRVPTLFDQPNRTFKRTNIRVYKPQFYVDEVVSQVDNAILFTPYESYSLTGGFFNQPDLGGTIKIGAKDLLEDYHFMGGFRLPVDFKSSEYFAQFQNLKKRWDKKLLFYRKTQRNPYMVGLPGFPVFAIEGKNITHYAQSSFNYPFDAAQSLRLHGGIRNDKLRILVTDSLSNKLPSQLDENWLFAKAEYIFDNTSPVTLNIIKGLRAKAYVEFHKPFEGTIDEERVKMKFNNTGWLGVIGVDARHYQRVSRQITWANRFASAVSVGNKRLLYRLGGVENWLAFDPQKKYEFSTIEDTRYTYAFQSYVTQLRGFKQNIRNGTSYALLNSELRIPLFLYLARNPLRSEFLRSFQIVGFADFGAAWTGISPFNDDNRYTVVTVDQGGITPPEEATGPVIATVKYYRNPVVMGYGYGLRSKILGYFVKFDVAWGIDTGSRTQRCIY